MGRCYKAVILIGGPQKGTRFRPLSLDCPKPLFPIAGVPTIRHHIERLVKVEGLREILLIGFYQPAEINRFLAEAQREFSPVNLRYLQEYTTLGTAGGIYHFRDQICLGNPAAVFVVNCDACGDIPLEAMVLSLAGKQNAVCVMMTTEATREQSMNYGCVVVDKDTSEVLHYVEKPTTFVSASINCGIYLIRPAMIDLLQEAFRRRVAALESLGNDGQGEPPEALYFERDIFPDLASRDGESLFYAYRTNRWWSQIKTAAAAIYANRHYLRLYRASRNSICGEEEDRIYQNDAAGPHIIADVYIHKTASVAPSAKIGPNVSIGRNVVIGAGVRVKESIVLDGSILQDHCCVMYSIIGWNSVVGQWSRVEGTPIAPNPNTPFAKMENRPLFKPDGRLYPAITILGSSVQIPKETIVLNSIVLPHKELNGNYKNQIIL